MPKATTAAVDTSFLGKKGRVLKADLKAYILENSQLSSDELDSKLHAELATLASNLHAMSLRNEGKSDSDQDQDEDNDTSHDVGLQGGVTDSDNDEYVHFTGGHQANNYAAAQAQQEAEPFGTQTRRGRPKHKSMSQAAKEQLAGPPPLFVDSDSDQTVEGTGTTEAFTGKVGRSRSQRRRKKSKSKSKSRSRSRSRSRSKSPPKKATKKKAASKKKTAPRKSARRRS
jgi:hypothetical protein